METGIAVAILMFLVAFTYANVGLGGGLLYFPILSHFYPQWESSTVVALTLLFSIATLASSARNHYRGGWVQVRYVSLLAIPMAAAAFAGAHFTLRAGQSEIKFLFSCVLMGIALKMLADVWRGSRGASAAERGKTPGKSAIVVAVAAFAGFLSGSVGIGGGVIAIPLLIYFAGLETRNAVGTASFALLITASCGLLTYILSRGVHAPFSLAAVLLLSTFAGGTFGSRLGLQRLRSRDIRVLFIALLAVAALWTGIAALGWL